MILALLLGPAGCADSESALMRGDRLWADSNHTAALAEYRLAYQRRENSDEALVRVAHAYAITGELQRAAEHYETLVQRAPEYTDQAVFDFLTLARQARQRSDRYGEAMAVESALKLRPALPIADLASGLARYYSGTGDSDKALAYYERALAVARGDSMAAILYEMGELQETRGSCGEAITLFNAFRSRSTDPGRADEARRHVGSCTWSLAQAAAAAGDTAAAMRHIDTVINLGVPQNLMEQVWFQRGELLFAQGRADEALGSYVRSLEYNRTGAGQLADRARRRIDEIRFGG
jgi:tetratricopeptide (TPR) repeat protein